MAQQQQRYRVLEKIAAGGMAEVYRAESAGLEGFKKTVAIKRVLPHLAGKKQFIGMFLDEARLSAHLSHSNCVQVFDIGVGDDTYFIVMEFVDGSDLKSVIEYCKKRGTTVPIEEAVLICVRICEGLAYAHDAKDAKGRPLHIVHRDMSPPNVLITRNGEVKIVDFGLAKANSQLEKSEPGIIKGKFSYLSPEAATGGTVDVRTDIFAVGIILWEMLAGRRLFMGETDLETVRQVQSARVPSIRQFNPNVPPELEAVMLRGLTRDPRDRFQSARDFGIALNDVMFGFGRAVSSFDISKLIGSVIAERGGKRPEEKGSIIGTLIDEALFEFSSLDGDGSAASPTGAPTSRGFDDVGNWADQLGIGARSRQAPMSSNQFELGNLSALEDDEPLPPLDAAPLPSSVPPPPEARYAPPPQALPPLPAAAPPEKSGGSGGIIALVLVLIVAAGAAGAYFGGLFH